MSALEKKIAEHSFACHQSTILGQVCICGADEATAEYMELIASHKINYPPEMTINGVALFEKVMYGVLAERKMQVEKWGDHRNMTNFEWLAVIVEEVGEVARAMLQNEGTRIIHELIQVAAVAVAWAEDIIEFGGNDGPHSDNFRPG